MRFLDAILLPFRRIAAAFSRPVARAAVAALPALTGAGGSSSSLAEPVVRTYTDWTPAAIKGALRMADGGNLTRAADLCEAILGDDRAPGVLHTRVNALLGSVLTFEPTTERDKRRYPGVRFLEADDDWPVIAPEAELKQLIVWGLLLGCGLARIEWSPFVDHAGRLIPVLKFWHPRNLRWDQPTRTWRLKIGEAGEEITIVPGGGEWVIYTPYGQSRPWAHGLWRGWGALWLLKTYAYSDYGRVSEMHGKPSWVASAKAAAGPLGSVKLRRALAAEIAELGRDSVIALPAGIDLSLIELKATTWKMYEAQIQLANTAFAVGALGGNLSSEVLGSQQTGATAQTLVRQDYARFDANALSTFAHDQILTWWAEYNFGGAKFAAWPSWNVEPPEDKSACATVWKTVADSLAAFKTSGWTVDPMEVETRFGIRLLPAPEPVTPPQKPPPPRTPS